MILLVVVLFIGLNKMQAVTLTEAARTHIRRVLIDMDKPYLVFGLKGGGCAGFEYFWEPADDELYAKNGSPEIDEMISVGEGKSLIVDGSGLMYLLGSEIDYKQDFVSSQLVVTNPMAKSSCGCGTSISV
jgi:iron-sulfur cluster assembly accessory protein